MVSIVIASFHIVLSGFVSAHEQHWSTLPKFAMPLTAAPHCVPVVLEMTSTTRLALLFGLLEQLCIRCIKS
jgi:hypothetical protein